MAKAGRTKGTPTRRREDGRIRWPRRRLGVLYALNRAAMNYWHRQLLATPDAIEYLRSRGWDDPVGLARRYRLGYAPGYGSRVSGFVAHTLANGFEGTEDRTDLENALVAAGLARRSDRDGRVYDLFIGRLMFPIPRKVDLDQMASPSADIVAFGGRILPSEQARLEARGRSAPKYLNTPETPLFHKGGLFYGWPWAAGAIQAERRVIVLEGYTDLIRVREAGILNAVACLGTAVTPEHMAAVAKLFRTRSDGVEVVLATDADVAGRKAAERGARVVLRSGFRARIATFEGGKDPDELLKSSGEEGPALFRQVIAEAQTPVRNYLDVVEEADIPYWDSLSALVGLLRDVQERAAGASEELLRGDAERVAKRLALRAQLPIEPDNVLDLFRAAHEAEAGADV